MRDERHVGREKTSSPHGLGGHKSSPGAGHAPAAEVDQRPALSAKSNRWLILPRQVSSQLVRVQLVAARQKAGLSRVPVRTWLGEPECVSGREVAPILDFLPRITSRASNVSRTTSKPHVCAEATQNQRGFEVHAQDGKANNKKDFEMCTTNRQNHCAIITALQPTLHQQCIPDAIDWRMVSLSGQRMIQREGRTQ